MNDDFLNHEVSIEERMQTIRYEIECLAAHADGDAVDAALRVIAQDIRECLDEPDEVDVFPEMKAAVEGVDIASFAPVSPGTAGVLEVVKDESVAWAVEPLPLFMSVHGEYRDVNASQELWRKEGH